MNIDTTTVRRAAVAAVIIVIGCSGVTACGTEVTQPAQEIRTVVKKQQKVPVQPPRTSGNRLQFGDDMGNAAPRLHTTRRVGGGTRNRLDFRDTGR